MGHLIKDARYERIFNQLEELLENSPSLHSQYATINSIIYHKLQYVFWAGFYFYTNERLIVGPYQGPLACQELEYPKGVCWNTIIYNKTTIIENVHDFPGHIACDSRSKSEIVIPVYDNNNQCKAVFDLDSDKLAAFDTIDQKYLEKIIGLIRFPN